MEQRLIEAVIMNNPDAIASNLGRLGIAHINPDPSLIASTIRNIRPESGTELDTLSSILDVPIIPGNPGYDAILESISIKSLIRGNLRDYFSGKEFQKQRGWEHRIRDQKLMAELMIHAVVIFFLLLAAYIIFSLISKIFQYHE